MVFEAQDPAEVRFRTRVRTGRFTQRDATAQRDSEGVDDGTLLVGPGEQDEDDKIRMFLLFQRSAVDKLLTILSDPRPLRLDYGKSSKSVARQGRIEIAWGHL